jgi:pimeloyl-ACP methyl ester carboxylesterase
LDTPAAPNDSYILATHHGTLPPAPSWFTNALGHAPERTHFLSSGIKIELLTWGQRGKPGLLFLHGNGAHADWWSHIAPFFADDWRCAALSWSGMGRSDRSVGDYTIEGFATEAKDAAHAAGLFDGPTMPLAICHSMGGLVGMKAAVAADNIFRGVVLIDSPIKLDPSQLDGIRAQAPKVRSEHRSFQRLEDGLARFRLSPPQQCKNDFIADHIARHSLVQGPHGWNWHFDPRRVRIDAGSSERLIDHLRCPAAFIYGEHSAILNGATLARSIAALPPQTPVIAIPDAAHHIMIDQPLALIGALRALLTGWPLDIGSG